MVPPSQARVEEIKCEEVLDNFGSETTFQDFPVANSTIKFSEAQQVAGLGSWSLKV